jgi:hypothetical protein
LGAVYKHQSMASSDSKGKLKSVVEAVNKFRKSLVK